MVGDLRTYEVRRTLTLAEIGICGRCECIQSATVLLAVSVLMPPFYEPASGKFGYRYAMCQLAWVLLAFHQCVSYRLNPSAASPRRIGAFSRQWGVAIRRIRMNCLETWSALFARGSGSWTCSFISSAHLPNSLHRNTHLVCLMVQSKGRTEKMEITDGRLTSAVEVRSL